MNIHYQTEDAFYCGIAECVKHGLTFEAYFSNLIIKLSGGY